MNWKLNVFCFLFAAFVVMSSADYIIDTQTSSLIEKIFDNKISQGIKLETENKSNNQIDIDGQERYFLQDNSDDASIVGNMLVELVKFITQAQVNKYDHINKVSNNDNANGNSTQDAQKDNQNDLKEAIKSMINADLENIFDIYGIDDINDEESSETIEKFYMDRRKFWSQLNLDNVKNAKNVVNTDNLTSIQNTEIEVEIWHEEL